MPTRSSTRRVVKRWTGVTNSPVQGDSSEPELVFGSPTIHTLNSSVTADGPVPSFRRLIASGQNATSNLTGTKMDMKLTEGHFAVSYLIPNSDPPLYYWTISKGDLADSYVTNEGSMDLTSATNQAKMRFNQSALDLLGSFEGQVFLGELASTLHTIKNPLKALRGGFDDYFRTIKRRRKGSKNHRRKVLEETWLEFMFGWRPLISDAEDGIEALRRIARHRNRFAMAVGKGSVTEVLVHLGFPQSQGGIAWNYESLSTQTASIKYYGVVNLQLSNAEVIQSNLGFRLDRFVPSLWECFPWSFVVDYFSNIGDMLSAWSFGLNRVSWVASSSRVEYSNKVRTSPPFLNGPPGPGKYNWTGTLPGTFESSFVRVSRTPFGGSTIPDFRLEIPGMSSLKWLNLAALARTRASFRPY